MIYAKIAQYLVNKYYFVICLYAFFAITNNKPTCNHYVEK
ncbi:hypothetical protein ABIB50_002484 [Mucilaginibacter sp. UYCu711]